MSETETLRHRLEKVRGYLCRLAKSVTRANSFQVVRRDRDDGTIEYQIFADTEKPKHGMQVAYVQSTRHDADFIAAVLAQAPLFDELLKADLEAQVSALTAQVERLRLERDSARDQFDRHVEWAADPPG